MEWIPKGPDLVFLPRDSNYTRLSLYNEIGLQGRVVSIVIDPTNQHIIYALERPGETHGVTIFRKREGSHKWDPITDSLRNTDPLIDPSCIAIHPTNPNIIYVGTYHTGRVYRGEVTIGANGGANVSWGPGRVVGSGIRMLKVDPREANPPSTSNTHLFAGCQSGIFHSINDGQDWRQILNADTVSMIGIFPNTDRSKSYIYAGCSRRGVFYTDEIYTNLDVNPDNQSAARHWIPLSTGGGMLPRYGTSSTEPQGNFDLIFMDNAPLNPNRIYVWLIKEASGKKVTAGLYTTEDALHAWTQVVNNPAMLPQPLNQPNGSFNAVFAVSPNSEGNFNRDILFFGDLTLRRSKDGGRTWCAGNADFHADMHAIAFFPHHRDPADVYIGCDGGFAFCHHFAEPDFEVDPISTRRRDHPSRTRFNQGEEINERDGQFRNLNHGRPSSIIMSYSSHPEISMFEYIACQDTGISVGSGTSCWRAITTGDAYKIAVAPGLDGIKIWCETGAYDTREVGWPNLKLTVLTDKGSYDYDPPFFPSLPENGSNLLATSNLVELDKRSYSGGHVLENTTRMLNRPIQNIMTPPIDQKAYPSSMSGIYTGSHLILDERNDNIEEVRVTETGIDPGPNGARWFRANFKQTHNMNAPIRLMKSVVVSVDANVRGNPIVTQLGEDFGLTSNPNPDIKTVNRIGISQNPAYRDKICCATQDKKLWVYDGANNLWIPVQAPNSLPSSFVIHSITINSDGDIYWLLNNPIPLNTSNGTIETPLFKFLPDTNSSLGQWEPQFIQFTTPLPPNYDYKKIVSHPQRPDIIFISYGMKILKLTRSNTIGPGNPPIGGWQCEEINLNLPNQHINDLWIGEVKHSETHNVLLRAVLSTRGIWEADVSEIGIAPARGRPILYMRDNMVDHGWLNRSPPFSSSLMGRIPNPYIPESRLYCWHYQCPDIKLDLQRPSSGDLGEPYYQTDPESPLPFFQRDPGSPYSVRNPPEISYDMFEQIRDMSLELVERSEAWLHIQIHNHSNVEANDVYVWAIFCNAAAGVPSLNAVTAGNNTFNFWNRIFYDVPGRISHDNLPTYSRWRSIGEPRRLFGIKADYPKIASWKWSIPQLSSGNVGHYCIVTFVHSNSNPISERHTDLGVIVGRNRQIAQKNLHIRSVRR